jgi:pheromone shutdown protein TraB
MPSLCIPFIEALHISYTGLIYPFTLFLSFQFSDIVLGDQDVQVTLRRLSQALAVTDLDALTDPNSDLERSMAELLGGSTTPAPATGEKSTAEMKEELAAFVETMKSREKVRQIMGQLREIAPALVQVMLTERDTYMATGLDSLQNYEIITAVMGLAHQDGGKVGLKWSLIFSAQDHTNPLVFFRVNSRT